MSTKEVVMTEEWNESDDFKRVGTEGLSGEDIGEKSLTYWADVWRRFRENKLAIFGLILLGLIVVLLFIGPMVTGPVSYTHLDVYKRQILHLIW